MNPMDIEKEAARIQERLAAEVRVICPSDSKASDVLAVWIQLLVREIAMVRLQVGNVARTSVSNQRY